MGRTFWKTRSQWYERLCFVKRVPTHFSKPSYVWVHFISDVSLYDRQLLQLHLFDARRNDYKPAQCALALVNLLLLAYDESLECWHVIRHATHPPRRVGQGDSSWEIFGFNWYLWLCPCCAIWSSMESIKVITQNQPTGAAVQVRWIVWWDNVVSRRWKCLPEPQFVDWMGFVLRYTCTCEKFDALIAEHGLQIICQSMKGTIHPLW